MSESDLKQVILTAFDGVSLSGGVSLRQGEVMDNYGEGCTPEEFAALPSKEITDDWRKIPIQELKQYAYLSYMDPFGFRYYIPAFMLGLIDDKVDGRWSDLSIYILNSLRPVRDDLWDHRMMHYSALTDQQKAAIAAFLGWVRDSPRFDQDDRKDAELALANYWSAYCLTIP